MKKEYGRMGKRIAAVLLSVSMAVSMMPSIALADVRDRTEDGFRAEETLENDDFSGKGAEAASADEPAAPESEFIAEEEPESGFVAEEEPEGGIAEEKDEGSGFEAVEESKETSLTGAEGDPIKYTSVKELNAAIEACEGSAHNPALFHIDREGMDVSEPIYIKNKHIMLVGGELRRGKIAGTSKLFEGSLIEVHGGNLQLNVTVDGMEREVTWFNQDMRNSENSYLVYVNGGEVSLGSSAVLKNNENVALCICADMKNKIPGTAYLDGGKIINNHGVIYGGGVLLWGRNTKFMMNWGEISGNKGKCGGGICQLTDPDERDSSVAAPEIVIRGGEIKNNLASGSPYDGYYLGNGCGGGIYSSSKLTISGGMISGNQSLQSCGGGVFQGGVGPFTMTGGMISGNTAHKMGDGANVFLDMFVTGKFTMSGDANIPSGLGEGYSELGTGYGIISVPEKLKYPVGIEHNPADESGSEKAKGVDGYTLTEEDLAKFVYSDDTFAFRLKDNKIVLANPSIPVNYELKGIKGTDLPDDAESKAEFAVELYPLDGYVTPKSKFLEVTDGAGKPVDASWQGEPKNNPDHVKIIIKKVPETGPLTIKAAAVNTDATLKELKYQFSTDDGSKEKAVSLKKDTYEYDVELPENTISSGDSNSIVLYPKTNDENASVSGSQAAALDSSGKTTAAIKVTAEDGTTTRTYRINFKKPMQYEVAVNGSNAGAGAGAGAYAKGDTVTVKAGSPAEGMAFGGWTASSGAVAFADVDRETTTFVMPEEPVTVTAHWVSADATLKVLGYAYKEGDKNAGQAIPLKEDIYEYQVKLPKEMTGDAVLPIAKANNEQASVSGNTAVTLVNGKATAKIVVTPKNGQPITYTIHFIKPHEVTLVSSEAEGVAGAGFYYEGDTVKVDAGSRGDGYVFGGWTASSGAVAFADADRETTTFVMPSEPVTVTANWLSQDATLKTLSYTYPTEDGEKTEGIRLEEDGETNVMLPKDISGDSIRLNSVPNDANASVSGDEPVLLGSSGRTVDIQVTVQDGRATVVIQVTAQDGTTKTYTINFIRPYKVAVTDSSLKAYSGAGIYYPGDTVTIRAGRKIGYVFEEWTSSSDVTFDEKMETRTTFTMPAKPVTVTAHWLSMNAALKTLGYTYKGARRDVTVDNIVYLGTYAYEVELPKDLASDTIRLTVEPSDANATVSAAPEITLGDDGKATAEIEVTAQSKRTRTYRIHFVKPPQPATAETKTIEADADGRASLNPDEVDEALRAAEQDAEEKGTAGGAAVIVPIHFSEASEQMDITIPAAVLDELVSREAEYLEVRTNGAASFYLSKESLAGLSRMDGDGGIVIQTKEAEGLDAGVQKAIGDRPVLDAAVYRVENGSRIPIEELEDGSFTMRLSYQPAAGEDPAGLYGVSVDESGALHWLEAAYEEMNGAVALELTKSGIYGVGYLELADTKVSFSGRTTSRVTIAWQPVEAAEGYTIWYRPEGETKTIRKIIPSADRLSWNCRGLQPGTKYFYTVRPWVKTAEGYVFGPASKVLRATTKPQAARILKGSMENGKIKTVLRGPAAGADRYAICYSKNPDFEPFGVGIRTSYTTRSFPVNNTKTGYYVRVRSYRDLGSGKYVYGDWSNQVRVN